MSQVVLQAKGKTSDRRLLLLLAAGLLALIVVVGIVSPATEENDPRPTTYNPGSAGAKAAYLMLGSLGYTVSRWEAPAAELRDVDAAKTTLILASPTVAFPDRKEVKSAIAEFLSRGGRVLVTGGEGAYLIEGGGLKRATNFSKDLCNTTPEGQGRLARVGSVSMPDLGSWEDTGVRSEVEQRCGEDAVVVRYRVGAGEVVWWSSAMPLTNRGLKEDASLKLLLASIGGRERKVLFDEGLEGYATTLWETAKGLPLRSLWLQTGLIGVLLVLSFGRRNGPVRAPVRVVRSSPLEFAQSMGHLYQKAGATQVATDGARLRLLRFLKDRCGVVLNARSTPEEIAESVSARLGGEWRTLQGHLAQAVAADDVSLKGRSALDLVHALDGDLERIAERMKQRRGTD